MSLRLVFADCETTGIRPDRGSEIWELALIVRNIKSLTDAHEAHKLHDDEHVWHLRPEGRMDAGALKVGDYYQRCKALDCQPGYGRRVAAPIGQVSDGEASISTARCIAAEVAVLLDGAHLIGANPHFDAAHIDALLERHDQCLTADYHYTDLGSLVRGWLHGRQAETVRFPLKLADAARLVELNPDDYGLHTGLGDCRLGRDIYDVVTWGAP